VIVRPLCFVDRVMCVMSLKAGIHMGSNVLTGS
jgi:hypothetical protein